MRMATGGARRATLSSHWVPTPKWARMPMEWVARSLFGKKKTFLLLVGYCVCFYLSYFSHRFCSPPPAQFPRCWCERQLEVERGRCHQPAWRRHCGRQQRERREWRVEWTTHIFYFIYLFICLFVHSFIHSFIYFLQHKFRELGAGDWRLTSGEAITGLGPDLEKGRNVQDVSFWRKSQWSTCGF